MKFLDLGEPLPTDSIMVRVAKERMPGLMAHYNLKLSWFTQQKDS